MKKKKIDPRKPRKFWIVGVTWDTEDPVTLGRNGPSSKPLFCTLSHAQFVASYWASVGNKKEGHPIYSEVTIVLDHPGDPDFDPKLANPEDIIYFSRCQDFEVFGIKSQESEFSRFLDKLGVGMDQI